MRKAQHLAEVKILNGPITNVEDNEELVQVRHRNPTINMQIAYQFKTF